MGVMTSWAPQCWESPISKLVPAVFRVLTKNLVLVADDHDRGKSVQEAAIFLQTSCMDDYRTQSPTKLKASQFRPDFHTSC
jgi:hypothetical protein